MFFVDKFFKTFWVVLVCFFFTIAIVYIKKRSRGSFVLIVGLVLGSLEGLFLGLVGEFRFYVNKDV